ncbi:Steroid 5 alpha-reductase 3 [Coemansia sp. RSA 2050]|nr:Steroid 5 alpha-reductase 3 [Coemansia sp. RSA 2050]KAJ2737230.1 Steroid 5 alpha-reductase 3 [Coemansia sp. BCRC 34962]
MPELSGAGMRFFGHRYLLFEQWLLGGSTQSKVHTANPSKLAVLSLVLFTIHVLIRLKECVYDQPSTDAKMHIGQYAVGIVFYLATPLAVVADSYYPPGWASQTSWTVPVGIAIFIYASIHQWRCHQILYGLRRRGLDAKSTDLDPASTPKGSSAQPDNYAIPTGDLFRYVSCPHFLCEILIYISIWLASACQATTLLWVIGWTAINLCITARESQQWYRARFGSGYPRDRRALVPFVW